MDSRIRPIVPHKHPYKTRKKLPRPLNSRLDELRLRYGLSVRDLSNICGGASSGVSKTTMHRLLLNRATDESLKKIMPSVLEGLRRFLKEQGRSSAQIEADLANLFNRDDPPFTLAKEALLKFNTWGQRLDAFRQHYHLSYDSLASICGGADAWVSRSTLQRIGAGKQHEPRFAHRCKPYIFSGLRRFLESKGRTPDEIEAELKVIFPEEESAMIAQRSTLPVEVQRFFGLRFDPFDPTRAPRTRAEVFTTPPLDKIAEQIEDAINYQGFLVVTGEIGSGKTIMKLRTNDTVGSSGGKMRLLWPEFFNMDRVHSGSIAKFILDSFDQRVPADLVARAARLKRLLADLSADGVRVALGFDECHRLHDRLLTALKNFWEIGSGGYDRYLGVVLFGQPQFEGRLRDHRFREIVERIDNVRMPPFGKYAWDYVIHRVRLAGGQADKLFEREAIQLLTDQLTQDSTTTPQAIGNLANAALLKAHQLGERKVLAAFIEGGKGEPRVRAIRRSS